MLDDIILTNYLCNSPIPNKVNVEAPGGDNFNMRIRGQITTPSNLLHSFQTSANVCGEVAFREW